ncbi:hypothetical protein [Streptomyces sp. NPDC050856]|uniref:hypothetical protein n=1 Tax=Streptomyces sp. NPDC050856 TaxID=3154939 RepID=UPI00340BD1C6
MSPSLEDLLARADARGLAAAALACLDRCLPLLDPPGEDVLHPLWCGLAEEGTDWAGRLAGARAALEPGGGPVPEEAGQVRRMLAGAPSSWDAAALRGWAEECSRTALDLHERLGGQALLSGERRRQARVLDLLADGAPGGLRPVRDVSAQGRRVLLAVVSRRARGA